MTPLLAAIDPNTKWYVALVVLTLAVAIGVPLATRVIREAKGEGPSDAPDVSELFGPLAEAYAAGQMSEEEYQRIRASLNNGVPDRWAIPTRGKAKAAPSLAPVVNPETSPTPPENGPNASPREDV